MSDLIKREDAIKEINNAYSLWNAESLIRRIPTADRPKGEWTIRFPKLDNGMGGTYRERRWYCSACSNWQTYGETPFCPWCGAPVVRNRTGRRKKFCSE